MQTLELTKAGDCMDDLNSKIDRLSDYVHAEFKAVRSEMKDEFIAVRTEMKEEFRAVRSEMKEEFRAFRSEIQTEFGAIHSRLDGLQRSMVLMMATILVAFASLILTQL